jgi:integrase
VRSALNRFAGSLMPMAAAAITTDDIVKVLAPTGTDADVWQSSVGNRLRMRIEQILTDANADNLAYSNPAAGKKIKGKLGTGFKSGKHHATMGYEAVPAFMAKIAPDRSVQSRVLQFIFLTVVRSGDAEGALWSEFDIPNKLWTIPADRHKTGKKTGREKIVVLPDAAIALLGEPGEGYVFPGRNGAITHQTVGKLFKKFASETVHGSVRASFGTWCQETGVRDDVKKMCLGHSVGSTTDKAYSRSQLIGFRRGVMDEWARFATRGDG